MYNRSAEEISNFIGLLLKFSRRSADSKPALYYLLPKVCVPEVISTSISISWGFFFTRCYHTRPNIFDIAKILFHKMHFNAILVISLLQNRLRITSSFKIYKILLVIGAPSQTLASPFYYEFHLPVSSIKRITPLVHAVLGQPLYVQIQM